jgi:hypothetical protein
MLTTIPYFILRDDIFPLIYDISYIVLFFDQLPPPPPKKKYFKLMWLFMVIDMPSK